MAGSGRPSKYRSSTSVEAGSSGSARANSVIEERSLRASTPPRMSSWSGPGGHRPASAHRTRRGPRTRSRPRHRLGRAWRPRRPGGRRAPPQTGELREEAQPHPVALLAARLASPAMALLGKRPTRPGRRRSAGARRGRRQPPPRRYRAKPGRPRGRASAGPSHRPLGSPAVGVPAGLHPQPLARPVPPTAPPAGRLRTVGRGTLLTVDRAGDEPEAAARPERVGVGEMADGPNLPVRRDARRGGTP